MLTSALDLLQYSCGGSIGPEEDDDGDVNSIYSVVFVKKNLNCRTPIEKTYYSAKYSNICYHCGIEIVVENTNFYPMCDTCLGGKGGKEVGEKRSKLKTKELSYTLDISYVFNRFLHAFAFYFYRCA